MEGCKVRGERAPRSSSSGGSRLGRGVPRSSCAHGGHERRRGDGGAGGRGVLSGRRRRRAGARRGEGGRCGGESSHRRISVALAAQQGPRRRRVAHAGALERAEHERQVPGRASARLQREQDPLEAVVLEAQARRGRRVRGAAEGCCYTAVPVASGFRRRRREGGREGVGSTPGDRGASEPTEGGVFLSSSSILTGPQRHCDLGATHGYTH